MVNRNKPTDWASHDAQIRKVLKRYCRTRSNWLRNILLKAYTPLVDSIISRRFREVAVYEGFEDLRQIGLTGFFLALERHDNSKGPFEAYARRWVSGEILKHLSKQRSVYTVSFETQIKRGKRSGEPTTLLNFLSARQADEDESSEPFQVGQQILLYRLMERLPDLQREVIELLFFRELTPREVALALDLTPQEAGTLRYKAVKKMREFLEAAEGNPLNLPLDTEALEQMRTWFRRLGLKHDLLEVTAVSSRGEVDTQIATQMGYKDREKISRSPHPPKREYSTSLVGSYRRRLVEITARFGLEKPPQNLAFDRLNAFEGLVNASRDGRLDDLHRIHPRAHEAIVYRFGLDDGRYRYRSLGSVGKLMGGITRQRVQQLEVKALSILGIPIGQ